MINYAELQEKLSAAILAHLKTLSDEDCKQLMKDFTETPMILRG